MSPQPQGVDFCLECHWEAFHIDGKDAVDTFADHSLSQWTCADHEHHASLAQCNVDETCCDVEDCPVDECSLECGSVCDGLVDCDASTVCSVAHCDDAHCDDTHCDDTHCDDTHCDDTHCDNTHCDDTAQACFDEHCCDGTEGHDCSFDSLLGLNTPISLDASCFLPSITMDQNLFDHSEKAAGHYHPMPPPVDPSHRNDFLSSYQAHTAYCDNNVSSHFGCDDFQKDVQGLFTNYPFSGQADVNPTDVFHMLGVCPDLSNCPDQHALDQHECQNPFECPKDVSPVNCFNPDHSHTHGHIKNPNDLNLQAFMKGPHRTNHRCRVHAHSHAHPYSPYSRQSRSSVSSHLLSSPAETPPPLDGSVSSVLTTSDFSAEDNHLHTCKWTHDFHGAKTACGATFSSAGALQEHLVSSHMNTIEGAKGNGYYCRWEGCHRPDEPFSQKSKLQGHFLTHNKNFKCSVCGKIFARQTTLDRHERSHRGDKPYKCKHCHKSFTDSSELRCTKSFTRPGTFSRCLRVGRILILGYWADQLKRHMRTTHKQESSSTLPSPRSDQFSLTPFSVI
ncbi:Zinc finger C2H2 [Penicillium riverlandense]|uniref:Zinc finger C2H2 n=1 Tax=Penicillium riverlandense TaxID=1903569 RepID=UPI00254685F2|nr:Zinc finger C2H2 [Penicillium riverlandense]KAJ5832426.1 Zinc finger C2H2 [Penicillium riverlandense]